MQQIFRRQALSQIQAALDVTLELNVTLKQCQINKLPYRMPRLAASTASNGSFDRLGRLSLKASFLALLIFGALSLNYAIKVFQVQN